MTGFHSNYAVICDCERPGTWVHTLAFSERSVLDHALQASEFNPFPSLADRYDAARRLRNGEVFSYSVRDATWYVGKITDDELREVGLL